MTTAEHVRFRLNGVPVEVEVSAHTTLLRYLRDGCGFTGAKLGCGTNHCGTCTVIVDGRAVRSCALRLTKLQGAGVETIEGLVPVGALHPIQSAFLAAGAVQCGFCTPGMIMATKALLDAEPAPTDARIREALARNLCRCTGYVKIIDAVHLAARWVAHPGEVSLDAGGSGLGRSVIDYDGVGKVTGSLRFADDLTVPGIRHGKVVWSAHPHAEVLEVDTAAARALPGVAAVLTAADVPGHNGMGSLRPDQPVLAGERVRFMGDAVAVVFADTPAAAEAGAAAVTVRYRELPGVFSPEEALVPGAPRLHPQGNVSKHLLHQVGDVDRALVTAALVVEGHFETPFVEHAYLEPESALAHVDREERVTVEAPTQFPFELRRQLAAMLGLGEEQVRVVVTPLGGGFGSKLDHTVEALAALGAWRLRGPVKITLNREESLRVSTKRHPYVMDYRVGFAADGTLQGVDATLRSDAGPYTALSPRVIDQACIFAVGPYRVPHVRVEGWAVHTNNANASAFRGFGINQVALAIESLIDEAGRRLGLDPFAIRMVNALEPGDHTLSGEILRHSVAIRATLDAAQAAWLQERPRWESAKRAAKREGRRIGVGVAAGFKNVGAGKGKIDDAGAIFSLEPDGRILLRASAVDMGQGIRTALLQIAAQVLDLPADRFTIVTGDTARTIPHGGAVGERQTLIAGRAVEIAARLFRQRLLEQAAAFWVEDLPGTPAPDPATCRLGEGVVWRQDGGRLTDLDEMASRLAAAGDTLEVASTYVAPKTYALADGEARRTVPPEEYRNYPAYAYTTQVAVVEVEETTGKVRVLRVIAAHDCGRAINPQKIEGQIEGSCLMGQGYALSEAYVVEEGRPRTRTYGRLGTPTILEAPEVRCLLIEDPEPEGPFGAKGIAEVATVPITPAILNAIRDAVGVRLTRLPATSERVLAALAEEDSKATSAAVVPAPPETGS